MGRWVSLNLQTKSYRVKHELDDARVDRNWLVKLSRLLECGGGVIVDLDQCSSRLGWKLRIGVLGYIEIMRSSLSPAWRE